MVIEHATSSQVLAEGKTKIILSKGTDRVIIVSKDDITAGDGARHDVIPGKGEYSTQTTCLAFCLLSMAGIPGAYMSQRSPTEFEAYRCEMFPYEVVVRRVAAGSYCKRHPDVIPGTVFGTLVVEFYLKTTRRVFRGISLEKDDPLIVFIHEAGVVIARPDVPQGRPGTTRTAIPASVLYGDRLQEKHPYKEMERLARLAFLALEMAWSEQGCTLMDMKVEFGLTPEGKLVTADVIDADSWRLLSPSGKHLDKQPYREGASLAEVAEVYAEVAKRTEKFRLLGLDFLMPLNRNLARLELVDAKGLTRANSPTVAFELT